jgi:hypothetical protein
MVLAPVEARASAREQNLSAYRWLEARESTREPGQANLADRARDFAYERNMVVTPDDRIRRRAHDGPEHASVQAERPIRMAQREASAAFANDCEGSTEFESRLANCETQAQAGDGRSIDGQRGNASGSACGRGVQ